MFVSFEHILGTRIFDLMYRPDWRTAQAAAVRTNCLSTDSETFVVTDNDTAVGFAVLMQDHAESLGVVDMIAVHPDHQRRGHARRLITFAIEHFEREGMGLVNVGTAVATPGMRQRVHSTKRSDSPGSS